VTLSGRVVTTTGAAIPGIQVYFWRQDGGKSFYVTTDKDGKFSAQVEKSTALSMRYNIAANRDTGDPSHPKNPQYTSAELLNVAPGMDRAGLTFRLDSARVTLGGKVTDISGRALPDIWISFTRKDGKNSFFVKTGADGKYSALVEKSGDKMKTYTIAANKDTGDASHPKNPQYTTAELTSVLPSMDRSTLNFRLEKGLVTLGGRVTDSSGKAVPDLWVYYWRQDGQDSGYARTNMTGYYSREVARFPATDRLHRYNLAANKDTGDASHPKNPAFATKELLNITPDMDRMYLNFKLVASR
jgi:hypothetical protein